MLAALALSLLATEAHAHAGCGGHEIGRRNLGLMNPRQAAPTNVASGAVSIDPAFECTDYYYEPASKLVPLYPPVWPENNVTGAQECADILPNDTEAMALFQPINATLNAKFPNDRPHGTLLGDFAGVQYNYTDPDCWWSWAKCDTPKADTGLQPDITTVPTPETWGLGFDDGPNCSHNALYDYLQENNQRATMFYIGSNVLDWPLQALRATTDGHQICVHTWSHKYMTALTNSQAFAELYYARKVIKDLLGVTPQCWRPPYGDVDNRIRYIASQLNLTTIVWSDDSQDWREGVPADNVTAADVTLNYQAVVDKVSNGTYINHGPVVLTHELTNFTMSEFISQYPSIKNAFKHVAPLCVAYNITHPYVETDIVCPSFSQYISGTINISSSTPMDSSSSSSSGTTSMSGSMTGSMTGSATSSGTSASATSKSDTKTGSATPAMKSSFGLGASLLGAMVAGLLLA
ncbi:hypothetical protein BD324DRAFT_638707 [Kockovaella imperatae]|uniref:chitin deacetylase n=1 Tax=Kockovaella imperatae TaxID=4999 RepID=A0A1Y1U8J1_9TREE|nr:hypothetical protein BD324DRAFT_638707 [Kockovaella imperatae]ORX33816.1 hypothetical protein BD324DRAFT_638707 [Kockovaella imperatae]